MKYSCFSLCEISPFSAAFSDAFLKIIISLLETSFQESARYFVIGFNRYTGGTALSSLKNHSLRRSPSSLVVNFRRIRNSTALMIGCMARYP